MNTNDTPLQKSIDASRSFLARKDYGEDVYRVALESIAMRGVELPPRPEALDEGITADTARTMEAITKSALGYKDTCNGLTWLVSELLAVIERDTGVSRTDVLTKIEAQIHSNTPG